MKVVYYFVALTLLFSSCQTSKTIGVVNFATPQPKDTKVEIFGMGQKLPEGLKLLGQIKIGDSGLTTNCGYDTVISQAQDAARTMGGNVLQITWHKEPNILGSSCHRIKADVYLK